MGDLLQRRKEALIIGGFILFLCLPTLDWCCNFDRSPAPNEKRVPAGFPLENVLRSPKAFTADFDAWFNDHFGFRKYLIGLNNTWKLHLFGDRNIGQVIIGRDGWLYLATEGEPEDYIGLSHFTVGELEDWRRLLESRRDFARALGAQYLFVVAPDKQSIYPEFMPSWIKGSDGPRKLDQFISYMRTNSSVEILDVRPALLEAKKTEPVYYNTDSHWNAAGAFVSYRCVMEKLAGAIPDLFLLSRSNFNRLRYTGPGTDLVAYIGQGESMLETNGIEFRVRPPLKPLKTIKSWQQRQRHLPKPDCILTECPGQKGRMVVFRDSFADGWIPFFGYSFKEVIYAWRYEWDREFLLRERPEVIVDEMVQRRVGLSDPREMLRDEGSEKNPGSNGAGKNGQ